MIRFVMSLNTVFLQQRYYFITNDAKGSPFNKNEEISFGNVLSSEDYHEKYCTVSALW
jgi:hypothetical protein